MRILFFITKSEAGGAQTHVAQLSRYLIEHGHQVGVMSAPGGWLETETQRLGAKFFPNKAMGNTAHPLRLCLAAHTLLKTAQHFHPDLLACHSTIAGLIGRFTIRNRVPTVFTAHGWSFTQGAKLSRRLFLPVLERWAARNCQRIICVSSNDLALAKKYKIAPDEKLVMIHNGVERVKPLDVPAQKPGPLGMTTITFIGRLAAPKEPQLLLQAIAALPDDMRKRVHLTIVGDGPQRKRLQKLAWAPNPSTDPGHLNATLVGQQSREQIAQRLSQTDIFVLPSRYEGLPYSILEAMAAGVPVIASDVGGVCEAVGDDAGILIPPGDMQALKDALVRLLNNPLLGKKMGEAGRHKVETIFSLDTMCHQTSQTYLDMLNRTC